MKCAGRVGGAEGDALRRARDVSALYSALYLKLEAHDSVGMASRSPGFLHSPLARHKHNAVRYND